LRTAADTASDVRAGLLSPVAVVEESLERIAAFNPALNAFIEVRAPEARAAARAMEEQLARGADPGPLAGAPIAVKDAMWEAGVPSTDGSRALADFIPAESTAAVERLEAAGAIIVGRSNVPEFCYRGISANDLYGTTSNPWDLSRTPGGSSGGSGAAVAAGLCTLATGSDGGGSVRIPASFCGIVGLKPTFGLVPREPGWPGWWTLSHVGPMASTVLDTAIMLAAMAGHDRRDPASLPDLGLDYAAAAADGDDLRGLRVAV
jgi:Asp-tRNA(Asn)/Glu-tRNA(Gln) amidotransferase A subunit family amidase